MAVPVVINLQRDLAVVSWFTGHLPRVSETATMWRNSGGREKSSSSSSLSLSSSSSSSSSLPSSSSSSSSSQSSMGVGNQSGWWSCRCEMTQGAAGAFHHFLSVMYAWGRGRWQSWHTHIHIPTLHSLRVTPPSSRLFHLSPCYFPMNMWIELTELYDGGALRGTRTFAGVPVAIPLGTALISCGYVSSLSCRTARWVIDLGKWDIPQLHL